MIIRVENGCNVHYEAIEDTFASVVWSQEVSGKMLFSHRVRMSGETVSVHRYGEDAAQARRDHYDAVSMYLDVRGMTGTTEVAR